jgi:hypothetical protein
MLLSLIGCAGKGERIDIAIPGKHTEAKVSGPSPGTMRVAVLPFEDKRQNQAHLGKRSHLWGGTSVFALQTGTLPEATAQALVEFLVRQRWQATLARDASQDAADVTIKGTIQDLSIDAVSHVIQTELTAKNTLLLEITNRSDGSVVRERLLGTADDWVFLFEPEDAQALTTELFWKNFERFLRDIRVEGQTIRLR